MQSGSPWRTVAVPRTSRCGARGIASGLKAEAEYATEPRAKRHTTACAVALAVVPRVRRVLHRPGNTSREFRSRQATRYLLASGRNCCCRADYRCRCNHPSKFHNSDLSAAVSGYEQTLHLSVSQALQRERVVGAECLGKLESTKFRAEAKYCGRYNKNTATFQGLKLIKSRYTSFI